ncbi:hypothetical protein CYMTET_26139 [Cymbomonas tetramitiformis]|uniref:Uncharacterized protein n=1 Tax=Cymbomonas tetramitiformis TaxID=36881 RepID=A0AAE0FTY5_9CHLO|nr:hypothetical protein CYMTET_26139 [Cymbomonas tetramitiformis]
MAKKPLLASLDPVFYDKVLTPLRLDVELAKVDLEDIYDAHALEVWESQHGGQVMESFTAVTREVDVMADRLAASPPILSMTWP